MQYNLPNPHIVLNEEQISNPKKFNNNMLWIESMKDFLQDVTSLSSSEFSFFQNGNIVLFLDIEERKGLGGRYYRLYKILYEDKNLYFILSENDGELAMYFQPLSFSDS